MLNRESCTLESRVFIGKVYLYHAGEDAISGMCRNTVGLALRLLQGQCQSCV
jgi:hypothetical protein